MNRQDLARLLTAHVAAELAWRRSPTYGPAGRARKQAADDALDALIAGAREAGWGPRERLGVIAWVEARLSEDENNEQRGAA